MCEGQDCGPLFICSVTKHLKECKNAYSLTGKVSLDLNHVILRFDDSIWRERSASFTGSEGSKCERSTRDDSGGSDWFARPRWRLYTCSSPKECSRWPSWNLRYKRNRGVGIINTPLMLILDELLFTPQAYVSHWKLHKIAHKSKTMFHRQKTALMGCLEFISRKLKIFEKSTNVA